MTLSPSLVSMMTDELLVGRYRRYLDRLVDLALRETGRTKREQPHLEEMAWWYVREFEDVRRLFCDEWGSNVVSAFRRHLDSGRLEVLTCAATHGFLPLMDAVPEAVRAQIHVGAQHYRRHFDRDPSGIWFPECAYMPGHEAFLREAGLRFSFLEAHGLTEAHPRPSFGGSCATRARSTRAMPPSSTWPRATWKAFVRRYRAEMKRPEAKRLLDFLAALSHTTDLSVGCYCADESRCHRSVLQELLEERGASIVG